MRAENRVQRRGGGSTVRTVESKWETKCTMTSPEGMIAARIDVEGRRCMGL